MSYTPHPLQTRQLRGSVTTVDPQLSTSDVRRGVTKEEDDSAHQVLGTTHLTLGH
jgi:hypothetical protein